MDKQAVVSLWLHRLASLEEAVLALLESVLTDTWSTPEKLEQRVAQSLLVSKYSIANTAMTKVCNGHYTQLKWLNGWLSPLAHLFKP